MNDEQNWELRFLEYFTNQESALEDASHDINHFKRVYHTARHIAEIETEKIDPLVILAAAYFHDVVSLPKNHPDNKLSSLYAAEKAHEILLEMNFPIEKINSVSHAIETHSFSAGKIPETMEAKIIQDADRMESLGALGVMRTFYVSGRLGRETYHKTDPFAEMRPLDDKNYGLDHFYVKLFKLPQMLTTNGGKLIAAERAEFLHEFIELFRNDYKRTFGGTFMIMQACYDAGKENRNLFEASDPFAEWRRSKPSENALDNILEARMQFPGSIGPFIEQLRSELEGISQKRCEKV